MTSQIISMTLKTDVLYRSSVSYLIQSLFSQVSGWPSQEHFFQHPSTHLTLSSNTGMLANQLMNFWSGWILYWFAADWNSRICMRISNSFRLFSKFMRPSSVVSLNAVSTIIRSVRNVPRYGTVPCATTASDCEHGKIYFLRFVSQQHSRLPLLLVNNVSLLV